MLDPAPELLLVAAGVDDVFVATTTGVEVDFPRIEVPTIDCESAEAVATKAAGVIVLVYEAPRVRAKGAELGKAVKAFPAVLDKGSLPGTPVGKDKGLYAVELGNHGKL